MENLSVGLPLNIGEKQKGLIMVMDGEERMKMKTGGSKTETKGLPHEQRGLWRYSWERRGERFIILNSFGFVPKL